MRFETLTLCLALSAPVGAAEKKFYADDPIRIDPELIDASGVLDRNVAAGYDFVATTLLKLGDEADTRALNINTLDEVPDSSWFTNRIGHHPMSVAEVARGPDRMGPSPGHWRVVSSKATGITPGLTMRDARGQLYFVKFDPPGHDEMASAAEVITTKILYAGGYHVPENYIVRFRREDLDIQEARFAHQAGRKRPMVEEDLDRLLAKVAAQPDGSYRALASKAVEGRPIGPFRFYGTRADDPNDIFPHEHRRELRGLRVFAAWVNHSDSRGLNSIDTLVETDGRTLVRHYLLDFGSTLGSAAVSAKSRRSGNEYLWNVSESFVQIATFGLKVPGWTRVPFDDIPSVGRFESNWFDPTRWRPHYPNPAFDNARADDLFWGARRVMAFTDEMIEALVAAGELSDPEAAAHLTRTLIERRDKIGRAWLTGVNPLVDFELDRDGGLRFRNAAEDAELVEAPGSYELEWFVFDNNRDEHRPVATPRDAPPQAAYLMVKVRTMHPDFPNWAVPVSVYFHRTARGFRTVGLTR